MTTAIGLLVAIISGVWLPSQVAPSGQRSDEAFVRRALSRLSDTKSLSGTDEKLIEIQRKEKRWQQTRTSEDFVALTDAIYTMARKIDLRSDVTLSCSNGADATVKYQTLGQRKRNEPPTTAKDLTTAVEGMYIGRYHIWCERSGKATSDQNNAYDIVDRKESVTCQEHK